jgi:hypothetical protein
MSDHDWLVVTAATCPEPELEETDALPALALPDAAVAVVEPGEVLAGVVAVLAAVVARAGSFPVASCTKIPPEVTRNVVAATAATRRRICETRRLRCSATRLVPASRDAGRRAEGYGNALIEASGGVIVYLLVVIRRNAARTEELLRLIAMPCDADKEVV